MDDIIKHFIIINKTSQLQIFNKNLHLHFLFLSTYKHIKNTKQ